MSIYFSADDTVLAQVKSVMGKYHQDLVKGRIEVGVTFAISSKENQPALKEHGQPTFGMAKIVAAKDRIRKGIDVELWLDGDEWGQDSLQHKLAKIDHLLMRIEVKKQKPKKKKKNGAARHGTDEENQEHEEQEFQVDNGGKAVLKMRKPDLFVPGGYREVIERHGAFAPECIILDHARVVANAACEVADAVEVEEEAQESAAQAPEVEAVAETVAT